jgi:hypothetical protein
MVETKWNIDTLVLYDTIVNTEIKYDTIRLVDTLLRVDTITLIDTIKVVENDTIFLQAGCPEAIIDTLINANGTSVHVVIPVNVEVPVEINNEYVPVQKDTIVIKPETPVKPSKPMKAYEASESWESSGFIGKRMSLIQPDEDKIKEDLVGCTVSEQLDGYQGGNWTITIADGTVRDVEIIDVTEDGQYLFYVVNVILQAEGSPVVVSCDLQYQVGSYNWVLKTVYSKALNYQKTGYYDDFVTMKDIEQGEDVALPLVNQCNVTLVVGGTYSDGIELKKFVQNVPGNGISYVKDSQIIDAKIDFVEIPF